MSDFGGKLRLARERRGISLRQIAAITKISPAALDALERNDFSKLPGGIFSRAFVRSYAVEVGLDPDETVREFLDRFQSEPASASAVAARVPDEESNFESQQRMASVLLKLVLISIPIAGAILYFTLRSRPASPPAAPAPVEQPAPPRPGPPRAESGPQDLPAAAATKR
jgi:cytoskeletal protein RodZ